MQKLLNWLGDYFLSFLAGFLLIFIPLYPKLPLLEAIPGYIVRVRLEDFLVSFCLFLWVIYFLSGKIKILENPLLKPLGAYLLVGFLSVISAIFLTETVPWEKVHLQKIFLHYLRRIEYFSLFFIFYTTTKSLKQLKIYFVVFVVTVMVVSLYGFGQKYLYWPAFSTMNREFAKGWMLYLTQHARVLSTFGGHYDLAAFIMMALILLWSLFFSLKKLVLKILIFLVIAAAFWTLILTASRTSFIAYLAGLSLALFFFAYRKGLKWFFSRWMIVISLSVFVMLSFGDLSERFTKFLKINQRLSGIKSLLLSPIGKPPEERAIFLENNPEAALAEITSKSDQPPSLLRPIDVYQDIPLTIPSSQSGEFITVKRVYSPTAFRYDLSTAIRLDALWPMALKGFKRNPLLGSGYSTLNKKEINEFTEAESTDNDYLRSLGETGILGFLTFFGTLLFLLYFLWRNVFLVKDPILLSLTAGLGGTLFGLLVNALYIDIFESSKVAFTFWALVGLVLAGIKSEVKGKISQFPLFFPGTEKEKRQFAIRGKKFLRSDFLKLSMIVVLAFILRLYKIEAPLADWHSWRQADTSAVTRNYAKHGINVLFPVYDDLSNVASGRDNPRGLRFVEFPLYNVASILVDKIFVPPNIVFAGRLTSIFSSLFSIVFIFALAKKYLGRKEAFFSTLFYAILPYNIFYNRVILPEPFLVFLSLGMVYFFDKFVEAVYLWVRRKIFFFLSLSYLFTASSLLVKPFAAFLFLPITYLWFRKLKFSWKTLLFLILFLVMASLPFFWWRKWMSQFPEGIPANLWLLNGDGIRFKGAFFYWLFAERLVKLILGYWGLPLFILGILAPAKKEGYFFHLWGLAMIAYVTVFATGNVRHDYYQVLTIPIVAIYLAKGLGFLLDFLGKNFSLLKSYSLAAVMIIFMEMFGWYHIRDFYNINHPEIVEAGAAVERKTPEKSLVIAPYNGDTAFLYLTNRAGWPILEKPIEEMIKMGAHFFVSVNFDDLTKKLIAETLIEDPEKRKYKLIEMTEKYVIIQLVPDKDLPK